MNDLPFWHDWVGFAAATLTTASFLPQALLTLRTRDVSGISLGMYGAFTVGVALWLVFGLYLGSWPIIVSNVVTLGLATVILWTKVSVERERRRAAGPRAGGDYS
jgi:MtN3 and saliva related transmembrane protein